MSVLVLKGELLRRIAKRSVNRRIKNPLTGKERGEANQGER